MARTDTLDNFCTDIADSIREKTGETGLIPASEFDTKIRNIETGTGGSSDEWQPQSDWWDIDSILENDTEDYQGKIICLLSDNGYTTTIPNWNANKIKLSDGTEYSPTSQANISHTWDITKDKECSLGYKTRYVIYYFSNKDISRTYNYSKIPEETLYCIFKNMNITITNQNWQNGVFQSRYILEYIKFIDTIFVNSPVFVNNSSLVGYEGLTCTNWVFNSLRRNHALKDKYVNDYLQKLDNLSLRDAFSYNTSIREVIFKENSTSNSTDCAWAFEGAFKLFRIVNLNLKSATNITSMFGNCNALIIIDNISNIKQSGVKFDSCPLLTHQSLINILNALYDYSSEGSTATYTLTLGTTNLNKLTDEEKAIATNKGWTLA